MDVQDIYFMVRGLQLMTPRQRRKNLQLSTAKQMRGLAEACYNLLKNQKFSSEELRVFGNKHGRQVRLIADKSVCKKNKISVLTGRGTFLSELLDILSPLLTAVIEKRENKQHN